jgi:uncharacterized protein YidB (DUF937 family)
MSIFDEVTSRSSLGGGGGMSPITMALLGLLAYRTVQGKGRLAEMLGRTPEGTSPAGLPQPAGPAANGGVGGLLAGLLGGGGSAGGLLSTGLGDLLKRFQQSGQGDTAESWIASGPNKPVTPAQLEQALGSDRIAWLMRETRLSRDDLLEGLSRELPPVVDKLTPAGRLPTAEEAQRMV